MTYSLDLRKKALDYLDTVGNRQQIVQAFNILLRTFERWIRRRGENCLPAKQGKSSSSKIDEEELQKNFELVSKLNFMLVRD
jgi:transposase